MHNTGVIIWYVIVILLGWAVLHKVIFQPLLNVLSPDVNVAISVWAGLFVIKTDRVSHFVNDDTFL